jgi:DNA (cytosine-5)-methyltransferase 1
MVRRRSKSRTRRRSKSRTRRRSKSRTRRRSKSRTRRRSKSRTRRRSKSRRRSRSRRIPRRRNTSGRKKSSKSRQRRTPKRRVSRPTNSSGECLRVGTDCSGIEAPIQALQQLGVPHRHVFSSDIDPYCIKSIKANYEPEILFGGGGKYPSGDITKRDIKDVPDIDLYVCGFPCQPFSVAGSRRGLGDKRGNVFQGCMLVISKKLPTYFILENVPGLLTSNNGDDWKEIKKNLETLSMKYQYDIDWKILNTKDYGIPQSRKRLFIVGRRDGKCIHWPKKIGSGKALSTYVDRSDRQNHTLTARQNKYMKRIQNDQQFVDLSFVARGTYPNANKIAPCLLAGSRYWCVPKKRHANTKEILTLQGFPSNFNQVVSDPQLKKQIGNSMSVCVLKELVKQCL